MGFKKTFKTSLLTLPWLVLGASAGLGESVLTNSAAYEATLDMRVLSQASGGIRQNRQSAVSGSTAKISTLLGPKWMLIYPSGFGAGLSYYGLVNSGIKGYRDQASIDELSSDSSDTIEATQSIVWHDYVAANFEYRFYQQNDDGLKIIANIGFGNAGFTQKHTIEGESGQTAIKSSAVNVVEIGAAYSLGLGSQYVSDAGIVYHMVADSAWSHLSTIALSLSLTKIIAE